MCYSIFNIQNFTYNRCTFKPPSFSASIIGGSVISSVSLCKLPLVLLSVVDVVEAILEDEIVSTAIEGFQ